MGVHEKYKSALVISGLVTFIAAYHYLRIFNSWTEGYEFPHGKVDADPVLTGKPFNDAYRYMDWLLTVPLLLLEIIFCMNLDPAEMSMEAWSLGISSGLMIAVGYPGELVIQGDLSFRFICFVFSFAVFLFIVYKLLVGLKGAIAKETNPDVANMLNQVCLATVISWCTYPVVYLFPFFGLSGAKAVWASSSTISPSESRRPLLRAPFSRSENRLVQRSIFGSEARHLPCFDL